MSCTLELKLSLNLSWHVQQQWNENEFMAMHIFETNMFRFKINNVKLRTYY